MNKNIEWIGPASKQQVMEAVLDMASCVPGSGSIVFYWNIKAQHITSFDHEDDRDHYNEWSRRPLDENPDNYVRIGSLRELAEKLLADLSE